MSIIGTIYDDVTTDVLGKIGPWQWLVTFLATLLMVPTVFNQYEDMLLLKPSDVYCIPPIQVESLNTSLCFVAANNGSKEFKCNQWQTKLLWFVRIRKTWLVFCDDKLKMLSISVISRMGLVFGVIIFGFVADSFGRKKAILFNVIAEIVFGVALIFCDSEGWFRLIIFLKSLTSSAGFYIGVIIICEVASNSWRTWLCTIVMSPRLLGMICTVPFSNSAPNMETYNSISIMYSVLCLIILRYTPESPQWLLYNRKISNAEKIIYDAAKLNGIRLCDEFKIRPVNQRAYISLDEATTCIGILKSYNVRFVFLTSICVWMLYHFLWSSIYIRIFSEEAVNIILAKMLCYIIIPGCLTVFSCEKLTMKRILLLHIILAGVFSLSGILFYEGVMQNFLSLIALSCGLIGHGLILNVTPRLFAINIRATVVGCCHATGQLGAITSILIFFFKPLNAETLIGIELAIASVLVWMCLILPDVDRRELPDVIDDMDYFLELSKPLRWASQKTSSISREETILRVYSYGSDAHGMAPSSRIERIPAKPLSGIHLWRVCRNLISQHGRYGRQT